jgi:phosphoribosylanthranilate isomerase
VPVSAVTAEITELVDLISKRGGRVQLNFNANSKKVTTAQLAALFEKYPTVSFITQFNQANAMVYLDLLESKNHTVLFDASGGRGVSPAGWMYPLANTRCGYAGGLGPDNLVDQLRLIDTVAGNSLYWVDMEGKLRDLEDHFSLYHAYTSLTAVNQAISAGITDCISPSF